MSFFFPPFYGDLSRAAQGSFRAFNDYSEETSLLSSVYLVLSPEQPQPEDGLRLRALILFPP